MRKTSCITLPEEHKLNMNDSHDEREVVTMHGVERTGVRFVLSNAADPSRADEYSAWSDTYGVRITRPGFLANAFQFETPRAPGTDDDPRSSPLYYLITPYPATS